MPEFFGFAQSLALHTVHIGIAIGPGRGLGLTVPWKAWLGFLNLFFGLALAGLGLLSFADLTIVYTMVHACMKSCFVF